MLTAIVLVCSLSITPDLRTCDQDNALDVMRVPEQFGNPATCFMHGQAYLAGSAIGIDLGEDQRVKVSCVPSNRIAPRARQAAMN